MNYTLSLHDALPISVTSDGSGQYRIVDLRPGTYTVTFTLPGFTTFKRDGIELRSEEHTYELHSLPTRRSSDLRHERRERAVPHRRSSPRHLHRYLHAAGVHHLQTRRHRAEIGRAHV